MGPMGPGLYPGPKGQKSKKSNPSPRGAAGSNSIFSILNFLGPAYKRGEEGGPMGPIKNYREEERECATTSGKFNYFSLGVGARLKC